MAQSLAKIVVHTVFSTQGRLPLFSDPGLREEMHCYLGGILKRLDCQPIIVGGTEDHVHLLGSLSRTCEASEMVKELKRGSSVWIKTKHPELHTSPGKTATGFFPLAILKSSRLAITSPIKPNIIGRYPSKMNFASCYNDTRYNSTSITCGLIQLFQSWYCIQVTQGRHCCANPGLSDGHPFRMAFSIRWHFQPTRKRFRSASSSASQEAIS